MEFTETLLSIEKNLFLFLNSYHTPFWDSFMWVYTSKYVWIPLVVVLFSVFVYRIKWKEAVLLVACAVLVGVLCDQISVSIIKPLVERLRPSHHPELQYCVEIVNNYRGGRYGFVSAHAANGFGIALFTSLIFRIRKYTYISFLWATISSYSRIYLGVHFISDVVGGMIVGLIVGWGMYYLYITGRRYILKVPEECLKVSVISKLRVNILSYSILVIICSILIYAAMDY